MSWVLFYYRMNLINKKIMLSYWLHKFHTELKLLRTESLNQHFECLAWFRLDFLHCRTSGFQLTNIKLVRVHDHMIFPSIQVQKMQVINILDTHNDIIRKCSTIARHTRTEVHGLITIDAKWIICGVLLEYWRWVCLFYL